MSTASGPLAWLREVPWRFDLAAAVTIAGLSTLMVLAAPTNTDAGWPEVAAGIGSFVLVLLRRWHPLPLLAASLVATAVVVGVFQRPTQLLFATLVLLATVCVRLDRWRAIALGTCTAVSLYVLGVSSANTELGDERAVIGIAWTAVSVGVADAVRSWRSYRKAADAEVRAAVLAAETQARQQVTEERLTIARELHDLLAHNLSVMNVQTGTALHLLRSDTDAAEASLHIARDAGRSVLDELRELLGVLRASDELGEPTSSLPTIDQLPDLVDTMRGAGLDVKWNRSGTPQILSPAVSLAAYRIVQEGLTNAAKHGNGSAELTTSWKNNGLSITLANETRASPGSANGSGHGLIGMRERAAANGGRFASSHDDRHFTLDVWLPHSAIPSPTIEP